MTSTSDVVEAARLCLQAVTAWRFDSGHPPGSDTLHDLRRDYHPETIESVSTALTDAEHIIKRAIAHVSAVRNAQTPVCRLPTELLRCIFEHYHDVSEYRGRRSELHPGFALTWVCSHWRAVALDHPVLWSYIDLTCPSPVLDCVLDRVARHHISVYYRATSSRSLPDTNSESTCDTNHWLSSAFVARFLHENLHRTKDLKLDIDLTTLGPFSIVFVTHAPLLERCVIRCEHDSAFPVPAPGVPLFGGCTPRLQSLNVRSSTSPWNSVSFSATSLTSLVLYCNSMSAADGRGLVQILERSPHLQELRISVRYDGLEERSATRPVAARVPRAELKRLHTLYLYLPSSIVYRIASTIHTPSLRHIELHMGRIQMPYADIVDRFLRPDNLAPVPLHETEFLWISANSQREKHRPSMISAGRPPKDHSGPVLLIQWRGRPDDVEAQAQVVRSIADIVRQQAASNVHTLRLDCDSPQDARRCDILLEISSVRCVEATRSAAALVMERICEAASLPAFAVALKNLEEIVLTDGRYEGETVAQFLRWCRSRCRDPDNRLRRVEFRENGKVRVDCSDAQNRLMDQFRDVVNNGIKIVDYDELVFECMTK